MPKDVTKTTDTPPSIPPDVPSAPPPALVEQMTMLQLMEQLRREMKRMGVAPLSREPLAAYLATGVQPNSFLRAVLSNDLRTVFQLGDEGAIATLHSLVSYLLGNAPPIAWGSGDDVTRWHEMKPEARLKILGQFYNRAIC